MTQTAARPMAFAHAATCEEHVTDQEILRDLIGRHAPDVTNAQMLDATWGSGGIWTGLPWLPDERLDTRAMPGVTCLGDFRAMPAEWTGRFHVVVFDPPHVSEAGATSKHAKRFGLGEPSVQHAPNVSHLFAPFLLEARRVLVRDGIALIKVMDQVHRGRMQYQVADLITAVRAVKGIHECDRRLKVEARASSMDNWQGQVVRHARTDYVYWIVVRKGGRC